jgi:ACS family D-galactonate transporter-like MFS transporter
MTRDLNKLSPVAVPVLALLVLATFINFIDRGNLSIAAPIVKDELGLSATQLGFLLSSFFWTYTVFQIIFGWLADRFDVNWILAIGFFLWSSATVATGLVRGLAALVVMRMILGIGESTAYPSYSKIVALNFPEQRRGFANALIAAATWSGSAFVLLCARMLIARTGWRPFFIGFGFISFLWLIPWLYWMPRVKTPASSMSGLPEPGILDLLKQISMLGTCVGLFSLNYVSYFLMTWLPFYLVRERQFSMDAMGQIGGGAYLVAGVSAAICGWLSDHWIAAGQTPTMVRKTFMATGLTCTAFFLVICAGTAKSSGMIVLLFACAAYGMCSSNVWAITQTLAGPAAVGKWTGLQNSIGNMAGILAPALTGIVVDKTGHFFWAFVITAAVALTGSVFWLFVVGSIKPITWESQSRNLLL